MDNNTALSNENILIPFPDAGGMRDGKEIKTWMNGWEEGYRTKMKEYAVQATSHSVKEADGLEELSDLADDFIEWLMEQKDWVYVPSKTQWYRKGFNRRITYELFEIYQKEMKSAQSSPIEDKNTGKS